MMSAERGVGGADLRAGKLTTRQGGAMPVAGPVQRLVIILIRPSKYDDEASEKLEKAAAEGKSY